ncbi:MAG: hypothetical protein ACXVZ4_08945 [Gaiellaceae bacterium]
MKRSALLITAVLALGWTALAFAAGFPLVPTSVGNGSGTVAQCDTDGFTIAYTTSAGNVTQAVVGGINAACVGGSLQLTLTDSSGASIGTGPAVSVAGATATVSLTTQPYAGNVAGFQVVITGP